MDPVCQALNLSDNQKCSEPATAANGIFCPFHAKQAYGLYLGHKKRNTKLDSIVATSAAFLAVSEVSLSTQTFMELDEEDTLRNVCEYLHKRHRLLAEVIQARRWHHDHFYPLKLDYGHEVYLDKLNFERFTILQALERAEIRLAEILYSKQKWFEWSRRCQEEDDVAHEKEKKKINMENAMFQRQMKQLQSRMRLLRAKEDKRRQEAFLEQAYQERLVEEDELKWDPIDDEIYNRRDDYIDLIRHFLWMGPVKTKDDEILSNDDNEDQEHQPNEQEDQENEAGGETANKPKTKKKKKKKPKPTGTTLGNNINQNNKNEEGGSKSNTKEVRMPDKTRIEPEDEMRNRLKSGSNIDYSGSSGVHIAGTFENPEELIKKTAPLPEEEVHQLMEDVAEIKKLLFCRIILSHASLLPQALKSDSIDEFLDSKDISDMDLRDICLQVEQPGLQAIRDACADFHRSDTEEVLEQEQELELRSKKKDDWKLATMFNMRAPKVWKPKQQDDLMPASVKDNGGALVDFGKIDD